MYSLLLDIQDHYVVAACFPHADRYIDSPDNSHQNSVASAEFQSGADFAALAYTEVSNKGYTLLKGEAGTYPGVLRCELFNASICRTAQRQAS